MSKFSADQPILDDQSEDSYMAWLDRKCQDDKEPWLFYGEDEDFINVVWEQFASVRQTCWGYCIQHALLIVIYARDSIDGQRRTDWMRYADDKRLT